MQFLRTLFWVVIAVVAAIFAMRNWVTVSVSLWGGMVADAKLPVLLLAAFLVGLLPPLLLYRTTRWRLRRRLEQTERSLAEARVPVESAPPVLPHDPPSAEVITGPAPIV